ncbi:ABC-2 type transport system ATP-binding protein [Thermosipho japonicus]|uniref:ABC-2 type transport system ATP-binding protein n=1 Tax=Thermosipho japonicus TaxID=90323 RepID=A0A841GTR0_9BACT|nr:ABC transporter ATP-binding protein [Thermosipho japonicus]MBB6063379.1 ABC-2 type transport system ATP-binding protein [Thermosipho japonicus]
MEKRDFRIKAVAIRKANKRIGEKHILKNVSFDIFMDEILALIGPNGAGKTTTIRCISGIYKIDSGDVEKNHNLRISVMSEKDFLWEGDSGYKNIERVYRYFEGKLSKEKINHYSEKLGLKEFLEKKVHTYSKGTKRKLSFLLALLPDPDLLILDEPMSGLDPISRINMREMIKELKKMGKSVLITSHDLAEVEKLADRFVLIKDGKILADDLIWDILSKYQTLEQLFIDMVKEGKS